MELLVIRHGQSEADLLNCHEGRADFPLTQLGVKQATLLANWLSANKEIPDIIFSSSLKRAYQTAEVLGKQFGVSVEYDQDLMEFNNGLLQGLSYDDAAIRFPIQPEYKRSYISFYGQETLLEFRARAEKVLSRIIFESESDKKIVIVSHGGMINMLFRSFMKLPMNIDFSIASGDTAVHKWKIEGEKRGIMFLNRLEHLKNLETI